VAAQFQALLGADGRVFAPKTLEELGDEALALRADPPSVIAVHGGDGTLHRTVAALGLAFGETPIPPLAILGGGTMNVVSSSLGIRQPAAPFLSAIVGAMRANRPLETVRRRCLRIGDTLGFIFGNGLMANFLGEYYGTGEYGPARATWLLLRAIGSALIDGPFIHKLFKRFEGTVEVDGQPLERAVCIGVGAATTAPTMTSNGSACWRSTDVPPASSPSSRRSTRGAASRPSAPSAPSPRPSRSPPRAAAWPTPSTVISTRARGRSPSRSAPTSSSSSSPRFP
jgi:hypothetical protein